MAFTHRARSLQADYFAISLLSAIKSVIKQIISTGTIDCRWPCIARSMSVWRGIFFYYYLNNSMILIHSECVT